MAGLRAATANDYEIWDDTEDLVVFPSPRSDLVQFPARNAFRRSPTYKELTASGGAYTGQDLVFLVPAPTSQTLDGKFPFRPGDVVRDSRLVTWTVLEAAPIAWGNVWRLMTRNLVLAAGLTDEVSILRPAVTTGNAAEPVFQWDTARGAEHVVQGLAARVQPTAGEIAVANDVQTAQNRFAVILGQQIDLRSIDRVLVTKGEHKGQTLQWISMANQERIDELPRLECLRV